MPLPRLTPLARREVDIVVGLDKPEAGRFVARNLTITRWASTPAPPNVERNGAPAHF